MCYEVFENSVTGLNQMQNKDYVTRRIFYFLDPIGSVPLVGWLFNVHYSPKNSAEKVSADYWDFRQKKFRQEKNSGEKNSASIFAEIFSCRIFSLVIISINLKITFSAIWNFQYILW